MHLAGRADLAAMLSDPDAPGREYIIHSTDEDDIAEAHQTSVPLEAFLFIRDELGDPPGHVIGYRTRTAKLGVYSFFAPGTVDIVLEGQEAELYDYEEDGFDDVIDHAPGPRVPPDQVDQELFDQLYLALFNPESGAVANELRQPLPSHLKRRKGERSMPTLRTRRKSACKRHG